MPPQNLDLSLCAVSPSAVVNAVLHLVGPDAAVFHTVVFLAVLEGRLHRTLTGLPHLWQLDLRPALVQVHQCDLVPVDAPWVVVVLSKDDVRLLLGLCVVDRYLLPMPFGIVHGNFYHPRP